MDSTCLNERLFTKDYILLCLANFLMILAQRMTNGILSLYTDSLGATATLTGLLSSAFTITALVLIPVSGQIVNHFSKKLITILGIVVISISTFGFSISKSVELLLAFRLLQGVGLAFTGVSCLTLLSIIANNNRLAQSIAYYSVTTSIAQALGPEWGLQLGSLIGFEASFRIEALIIALSSICILLIKKDDKKQEPFKYSYNKIVSKNAFIPAILIMLVTGANFTITSFITLYANSINVVDIGKYFVVNAISLMVIRPLADVVNKKVNNIVMLISSLVCLIGSLVVLAIANNLFTILIASVINAIGYGVSLPIIESLCLKSVGKNEKALASATNNVGSNIGILFGPIIAGAIKDALNFRLMFLLMSLLVVLAILTTFINMKKLSLIDSRED